MWLTQSIRTSVRARSLAASALGVAASEACSCVTEVQACSVPSIRNMSKIVREWQAPVGVQEAAGSGLCIYNSLIDEKVPFIPAAGPSSKQITWYTCGPTVYDAAHMGHARNYVTFDIVRRVLEDYFGYNCLFVMNVTDVDDKIILRARRNYLLQQYRNEPKDGAAVYAYALAAVESALAKQNSKVEEAKAMQLAGAQADDKKDSRCQADLATALKNEEHKAGRVQAVLTDLKAISAASATMDQVLSVAGDFVSDVLDKEKGAGVTDASIYRAHAARYEREFMEDMTALRCRPPSVLTRVSEYIPEIIQYVQRIVDNGMAYEANGSVYFDTAKFRSCGHTYGKLKPWAVGSALLAAEGESNFETSEKRSPMDFALWKASKPGEPFWESPWGNGRPGWHIECSAMASSVLGQRMDIHSGGEDLRFPHHDNELAQAEAHYHHEGCQQWVNYFLHSGHLEIEGLKMSKSLKNFITIRDALQSFSARQLRLMFVMQPWNKPMVYGEQARGEMRAREAQLKNFFQNVEVAVRAAGDPITTSSKWEAPELTLAAALQTAQKSVDSCLLDNINTSGALDALGELIKATNIYLAKQQTDGRSCQSLLLTQITSYVTRILSVFGVVEPVADKPGLGEATGAGAGDSKTAPILDAFAAFRDEVRALGKARAEPKEVLSVCDRVRDETLVDLGVRLEDRPDGKAVWKLDDPAVLRSEQAERARLVAEAAAKKLREQIDRKGKELDKLVGLAALPSIEVALSDKYSKWDEVTGEPTHNKDGQELDAKAKDKAKKEVEKAKKAREPLVKKLAEDPQYLNTLSKEIEALRTQLEATNM